MRYYLVSLGCPKNTVDAEDMGRLLDLAGHKPVSTPVDADILLVNTCGFIESARAESLQVLRELAQNKLSGQRLIATGCLSQRDGAALAQQVRGLDGILGTRRWAEILSLVDRIDKRARHRRNRKAIYCIGDPPEPTATRAGQDRAQVPRVAIQGYSAYLKIADGCSAPCAFCAIPSIKGPLRSRPIEDIIADARYLAARGTQEIMLIAQDTTSYGRDRGQRDALPDLIDALISAAPEVPWIRLMYAYPQHISQRLIEIMAHHPQICHYLDLPLQHAHPDTLRRMRRPANVDRVHRLIRDLRAAMPDIALRTAFIVGYPGETEAEFRALEEFVEEVQFDKVGVFIYSPEEGTAAYDLAHPVPVEIAEERYDRLMRRQQAISLARNQAQVGRTLDVLIEGQGEVEYKGVDQTLPDAIETDSATISIGRSYRDAPEIDGLILIEDMIAPGQIVPVHITGAMAYDLMGEVL
jgi:ribosomal protein S12 methylthiotransferase